MEVIKMTMKEVKKLLEWESERAERRGQEKQKMAEAVKSLLRLYYEEKRGEDKNVQNHD
jgi:hypothetical protein